MGIICETCGRDIDALGQDNMGVAAPLCEDCWNEERSHAVGVLRRENERLLSENKALADNLAEVGRKLDDARQRLRRDGPADCKRLRREIETVYESSRERALALTKLDECEMWLGRCEPREAAAPAPDGTAQEAAMPCLKDDMAHDIGPCNVKATVSAEKLAEAVADSLLDGALPVMRMAVE